MKPVKGRADLRVTYSYDDWEGLFQAGNGGVLEICDAWVREIFQGQSPEDGGEYVLEWTVTPKKKAPARKASRRGVRKNRGRG